MNIHDLDSIKIKLASPEDVLKWSYGEVTKSETINYKTQKAEKDGLFCEKIFGPESNYKCYCGKYKGIKHKGIKCDRCGVELTKALVRRERMGHINLVTPVSHIWFLKNAPTRIGSVLGLTMQNLESVIYFSSYIIISVNKTEKRNIIKKINKEFKDLKKKLIERSLKSSASKEEVKEELAELIALKKKNHTDINTIKPLKVISEIEFYYLSLNYGEIFETGTGAEAIIKILKKINLKNLLEKIEKEAKEASTPEKAENIEKRANIIKKMILAKIKPEWMFLKALPVLPADLRPIVQLDGGKYASSDLNNLYKRIINRNNRLKDLLQIDAPNVIVRNEKRMLQEAVDSLLDNQMRKGFSTAASIGGKRLLKSLADMIKGKTGRFRKNLLGKRVDYSGRSVIVGGPTLTLDQVGLPKTMALELFKPFVIREILKKELAFNLKGAKKVIEKETGIVWEILENITKNKYVLINRAPTLHRLSIQAFKPILIEGQAIQIHPLVCSGFNADFDGDAVAVHVPLSDKAQKEAGEIMAATNNMLKPATGMPILTPTQDIVLGCYWLTKIIKTKKEGEFLRVFSSKKEAILAYELNHVGLRELIKVNLEDDNNGLYNYIETSVGRILFNENIPAGVDFENKEITSKELEKLILKMIKKLSNDEIIKFLDKTKNIGFKYSTKSSITWGIDELVSSKNKDKIIQKKEKEVEQIEGFFNDGLMAEEERKSKVIQIWTEAKDEIEILSKDVMTHLGAAYYLITSGARGSWGQLIQMVGMKGLVQSAAGSIIETPIKSSYREGLNAIEYFISTHGTRKGGVSTALQTAVAGYLTRKLVDLSHTVIITEEDCGDTKGLLVFKKDSKDIGQDFSYKIIGRISAEDIKDEDQIIVKNGERIGSASIKKIILSDKIKEVSIRSPLRCKCVSGICIKCYGDDLAYNKEVKIGTAVGIIAAQSIGEPGTQLTMRVFHTGGVASALDITSGLTRITEILENRRPKGEAVVSQKKGEVVEIDSSEENLSGQENILRTVKIMTIERGLKTDEILEYKILANKLILIKKGDIIEKGERITEGNLNIKELFKLKNIEEVERYIINEVQKIYVTQGNVHDKYIEIIVKQMLNNLEVEFSGDTIFSKGEIVEKSEFIKINNEVEDGKEKAIANPVLLGITRATLASNSFLSAASFQETSRVLIKASLEGKVDYLTGIKENVILGKLIPVGTGFQKTLQHKVEDEEIEVKNHK